MPDSSLAIARLKKRLERLEPRRDHAPAGLFATGHAGIDHALGGGLARGRLHEVFADKEDAGAGTGMAALLCLKSGDSKPLLWLRTEAAQKGAGRLQASGLGELGLDPASLLLALLPDEPALLRAASEATRCAGLGALLVECWGPMHGLDLTASRRLMLAAEASGVTVFVLRITSASRQMPPTAADTRWRAAPALSLALEADAPGAPMFSLELLRRRAGPPAGPWLVEWNRDRSCFEEPSHASDFGSSLAGPPLSGPVLPLVAGGTPAAQPLRATG